MIIMRAQTPDWFTAEGAGLKLAQIRRRGIPWMTNWRFTTLTVDPERFGYDERACYEAGKAHMRRFLAALRDLVGHDFRWCWKMEFHRSGFVHWHLCWDHRSKLPPWQLEEIGHLWGLGRVETKRIRSGTLDYLWKYIAKESFSDGRGLGLPGWFLDHRHQSGSDRPQTYDRVRFWQTSRGFYTGEPDRNPPPPPPRSSILPRRVRDLVEEKRRKARVVALGLWGQPVKSATVVLKRPWREVSGLMGRLILRGRAAARTISQYVAQDRVIENLITRPCLLKLSPVRKANLIPPHRLIAHQMRLMGLATPF